MSFRRFVCETLDDVYRDADQITFFYFRREDDFSSIVDAKMDELRPDTVSEFKRAILQLHMPFPCVVMPLAPDDTDIAIASLNGSKRVLMNSGHLGDKYLNTHSRLLRNLFYELIGELARDRKTELSGRDVLSVMANYFSVVEPRNVGISGRMSRDYFSTWKPMDLDTCARVIDAAERAGAIRMKDRVLLDVPGLTDEFGDPNEHMRIPRGSDGTFY